jgi:peptidyl-prolyl cis-trans isomerase A (cyclophilin A)
MRIKLLVSLALLCLAAFAQTAQTPPAATPPRDPGLYARFETTLGNITVKLYEAEAPVTVRNFVSLAQGKKAWLDPKTGQKVLRPFYNGIAFHRVIPGFMIQVGDPTGLGTYDPGFVIPDEFHPSLKYDRPGRLGMANAGPKTGNCQFFITETPQPGLNNLHSIFGQVVEGQEMVQKIANVPRDAQDKPRTAVRITRVVIEREGPPPVVAAPVAPKKAATPPLVTPRKTTTK